MTIFPRARLQRQSLSALLITALIGSLCAPLSVQANETVPAATDTVRLLVETTTENAAAVQEVQAAIDRTATADVQVLLPKWTMVEVAATEAPMVIEQLQENVDVEQVRVPQRYQPALLPNDVDFSKQYALQSTQSALADIKAPAAWDVTTGSSDTVIAIIDGGIDFTHPDLQTKAWANSGEIPGNAVDDDGNGFIDDVSGWDFVNNTATGAINNHATHVAGLAAAASNNSHGIAGVDWQARLMNIQVFDNGWAYEDTIIQAITYAVSNGADIINLSLVGPASPAMLAAIEAAYAANVVVVAAVGNQGASLDTSPQYPACADINGVDMVIGVAATNDEGRPWAASNYGSCVNIAAPGYLLYSTKLDGRYGTMSGTSMSTPLVTGVAGLYKAVHPEASAAEVIAAVSSGDAFTGAQANEWNRDYKGILNAAKVVGTTTIQPPVITNPAPQDSGSSGGGGGGGESGGGGGGGGGGEEPQPAPKPKGSVKGIVYSISAADRKAPDFIQNVTVPVVVDRLFFQVFGRKLTPIESTFWKLRARSDKPTETKLKGAMYFFKSKGKTYDPKLLPAPATKKSPKKK